MSTEFKRVWNYSPYLIAIVGLIFIAWCAYQLFTYPSDGIQSLDLSWVIQQTVPKGPSDGVLLPGDKLIRVNGTPADQSLPLYQGKHGGDRVEFQVLRNGQTIPVTITLADPGIGEIIERTIPLFVALIFVIIGIAVLAFSQRERAGLRAFLFFWICALLLSAGDVSITTLLWTSMLYRSLLWIMGPVAVHFHVRFLQLPDLPRQRIWLRTLYLISALGVIWTFLPIMHAGNLTRSNQIENISRFVFLAFSLFLVLVLLLYAYRRSDQPGARGRIRIVILGGSLSVLSAVTLSILPTALSLQPILPYGYSISLLILLPLTYGYAIFRHHLIEVEKHINRGATYLLVFLILGGIYITLYGIAHRFLPINPVSEPLITTLLAICLAMTFTPVERAMQHIVDTAFYGGWYDYRSAINQITHGLDQIGELRPLAQTVSTRLAAILRLDDACVFLRDDQGVFSVTDTAPGREVGGKSILNFPPLPMSSLKFLLSMGEAGGRLSMREALSEIPLTAEELELLNSEQVHLWVPIIGHGEVQGYLALGPKYGGDIFSGEDMDILRLVSWQLAPIVENIHLVSRLRQHAIELEQRVEERTAELYEAKERVEAILASVGDGVVVTDLDRTIITVNSAFVKQSGFSAEDLIGHKYNQLLSDQNLAGRLAELESAMIQKRPWSGELIQKKKSGSHYEVQHTIAPVVSQEGAVIGYVSSIRDITQQKELDRLKDQFISDVSHELRTPVTNLSLYLDLLETAPGDKRGEYFSVLQGQCQLLDRLVEDILDLSRLEVAKTKKTPLLPLDLNQLIEQAVVSFQPLAKSSGLELNMEIGAALPVVLGNQSQLVRAISNLVGNAIRYTLQGRVCVRTFQKNGKVCIEVSDTGIGFDAEDRLHIFERFYRGKQVRQSKIHGTGLGLAIVKEIVDYHHGKIQVESELNKGSKFQIWLP